MKAKLQHAIDSNDYNDAKKAIKKLLKHYENNPDLAANREKVEKRLGNVMDGSDLIGLSEVDLLTPLDEQARKLILSSSLRVALGTAVSPKAFIDVFIILGENFRLIRKLAELYGANPGRIGMYRLIKKVIVASTVAGVIETGGTMLTEIFGVGVLTKLARKAGEGIANGTLTIRIGLAVVNICRPCPMLKSKKNFNFTAFVKQLFTSFRKKVPDEPSK